MELMHHYSTILVNEPLQVHQKVTDIWPKFILREALRHAFLLHGLLALSAINLADLNRGTPDAAKYLTLCDKHQAIALSTLRDHLDGNVTAENGAALFALAATTSISSLARSCAMANAHTPSRPFTVEEIGESILLSKGMREVTGVTHAHILDTPISVILARHSMDEEEKVGVKLPETVSVRFAALREMLHAYCKGDQTPLRSCLSALDELEDVYLNLRHFKQRGKVESGHVWRWPAAVSYDFARLITARHPPTLVIVAYFAAATSCLRHAWFMRDWGAQALEGVRRALDEGLQHWVEWPREQIANELAILVT